MLTVTTLHHLDMRWILCCVWLIVILFHLHNFPKDISEGYVESRLLGSSGINSNQSCLMKMEFVHLRNWKVQQVCWLQPQKNPGVQMIRTLSIPPLSFAALAAFWSGFFLWVGWRWALAAICFDYPICLWSQKETDPFPNIPVNPQERILVALLGWCHHFCSGRRGHQTDSLIQIALKSEEMVLRWI